MTATYGDDDGVSVTAKTADADWAGRPTVRIESGHKWCVYYAQDGDEETALMIRLCAQGQVAPAILADRLDEVEPPDPADPLSFDFTAKLRGALVLRELIV